MQTFETIQLTPKYTQYGIYSALKYLETLLGQLNSPDFEGVPIKSIVNQGVTHDGDGNLLITPTLLENPVRIGDVYVKAEAGKLYFSVDGSIWSEIGAGAGGVTDHLNLQNIGTNTHAQIDAALAAVPHRWALRYNDFLTNGLTMAQGTINHLRIEFGGAFTIWAVVKPVRMSGPDKHIIEIFDQGGAPQLDFRPQYFWMKGDTTDLEAWSQGDKTLMPEQWNVVGVCIDQNTQTGFYYYNGICEPLLTGLSISLIGADQCRQIVVGRDFHGYIAGIYMANWIPYTPNTFTPPGPLKNVAGFPYSTMFWDFQKDLTYPTVIFDSYAKNMNAWTSGDPAEVVVANNFSLSSATWEIVTDL